MTKLTRLFWLTLATGILVLGVGPCGGGGATPTTAPAPKATDAPKPAATAAPAATSAPSVTAVPKAAEPTKPAAAAAAPAKPANWPTKPITMIIPWDAGGSTDVGFRLIAPLMEKTL